MTLFETPGLSWRFLCVEVLLFFKIINILYFILFTTIKSPL